MAYVGRGHRKRIVVLLIVAACAVAVAASILYARSTYAPRSSGSSATSPSKPAPTTPAKPALSASQQAGRMVCFAVANTALAVQIAKEDGVSCFLLKPNSDLYATASTAAIVAASSARPFLAIDEEGGYVARLDQAAYQSDTAAAMGTMDSVAVRGLGKAMGGSIRSIGANLDFAPVVDIDNPSNQAIGYERRAFSDDPSVITDKAGAFAAGLRDAGVIPTYKHFPGLGNATGPTGGNSDTGTATTPDLDSLKALDLKPYASLLPGPTPTAVMLGNQVVPGLTDGLVASLSPNTYVLLRSTYRFNGVVFTDSLSAASIDSTAPTAVLTALQAGADLPLVTVNSADSASAIVQSVTDAISSGQLGKSAVIASIARVDALRATLP